MFTEERREKILELLKKNGRVIAKDALRKVSICLSIL